MEDRSTVKDQRPRNFYYQVFYVFVAQAASTCHWNLTAMEDDQRSRRPASEKSDSRQQGARELLQRAPDARSSLSSNREQSRDRLLLTY